MTDPDPLKPTNSAVRFFADLVLWLSFMAAFGAMTFAVTCAILWLTGKL